MATASAMSPTTWAVSTGCPNPMAEDSATGWAFPLPLGVSVPGGGLGVADGAIAGNRPDALPGPMSELETPLRSGTPLRLGVPPRLGMGPSGRVVVGEALGGDLAGEAGDGSTAITEYARTRPDIVFMDITMPHMEGIEATERIVTAYPDAKIVMVSSVGFQENIVAALQKGAKHFVQKPVKPELLYDVVKYVLSDRVTCDQAVTAGGGVA
ncbi:MAG: response regulator [Acidobacteria bacterium]|nr:response regulator [Acidobacteriota bacterium]